MLKSFQHAARGMAFFLKTQVHAQIHLGATVAVFLLAAWLRLSPTDWCWLIVAATLVWTAEALNTAVELLGDVASGGAHHPLVGKAKDVAAAGVLLAAMGAALIGVIILLPRF
ncbi:MAG: diacylglycerol kinase family protein [Vicinamibacteria bacterium]